MLQSFISGRRRVVASVGSVTVMVVLALGVLAPSAAADQATRTWVSSAGNDANACSPSAPCATVEGAYQRTAAGGEIDVMGPGGDGDRDDQ